MSLTVPTLLDHVSVYVANLHSILVLHGSSGTHRIYVDGSVYNYI